MALLESLSVTSCLAPTHLTTLPFLNSIHSDFSLGYAINANTADYEGEFNEDFTRYDRLKIMTYQNIRKFNENLSKKKYGVEEEQPKEKKEEPPNFLFFGNGYLLPHRLPFPFPSSALLS